jgi:hypothetical protein
MLNKCIYTTVHDRCRFIGNLIIDEFTWEKKMLFNIKEIFLFIIKLS